MNIYATLALVALTVIYVVDLSGFTGSWRRALKRALGLHTLRRLPPFDCGQCATWWATLAVAWYLGDLNVATAAFCAALAFLSTAIGSAALAAREILIGVFNKLADFLTK